MLAFAVVMDPSTSTLGGVVKNRRSLQVILEVASGVVDTKR